MIIFVKFITQKFEKMYTKLHRFLKIFAGEFSEFYPNTHQNASIVICFHKFIRYLNTP